MNNKHYSIVFATPGPNMHREYVKSLVESCAWLAEQGKTFTLLNRNGSFIPTTREWTIVNGVGSQWEVSEVGRGEFTYDRILWIDSDIAWTVQDLETLLSNDLDIVSGVIPMDRFGRIGATRFVDGAPGIVNWTDIMFEDEVFEVDGVSFGFLAVKSGVFEKMPRPWFKLREVPVQGHEGLMVTLGEDYAWCLNAKDAGFKVWIDQRVKLTHYKEYGIEL